MGIFFRSEEEKARDAHEEAERQAEIDRMRRVEEAAREKAAFDASPVGQARIARASGATVFQIDLELSKTSGSAGFWLGIQSKTTRVKDAGNLIGLIEAEGWRLEHAGYVYRMRSSEIQKEVMSSVKDVFNGEIVGIYIFRSAEIQADAPA